MTVLVTGATGVAGYNMVLELLKDGGSVRVLLRNNDPSNALLQGLPVDPVFGDLRSPNSVRQAMKGASAVCHMEEMDPFGFCPPEAYRWST